MKTLLNSSGLYVTETITIKVRRYTNLFYINAADTVILANVIEGSKMSLSIRIKESVTVLRKMIPYIVSKI
jgi:hypothetical protein